MVYTDYLHSEDWKIKRNKKRSHSKRCAICSSTENLDVHHLNYKDLYSVEQSDLRVFCRRCHFIAHDLHKQGLIKFNSTNHHSRFILIKNAVKKYLGITRVNMFREGEQTTHQSIGTSAILHLR